MMLYMIVSLDRLELPILVSEKAQDLADYLGTTTNNIYVRARYWEKHHNRSRIIRIEVDDD